MDTEKFMIIQADMLEKGKCGIITQIKGLSFEIKRRLLDLGVTVGTSLKLLFCAPFKDPVCVQVRRYKLCIRKSLLKCIFVKVKK